jgi:hypothetical protein
MFFCGMMLMAMMAFALGSPIALSLLLDKMRGKRLLILGSTVLVASLIAFLGPTIWIFFPNCVGANDGIWAMYGWSALMSVMFVIAAIVMQVPTTLRAAWNDDCENGLP